LPEILQQRDSLGVISSLAIPSATRYLPGEPNVARKHAARAAEKEADHEEPVGRYRVQRSRETRFVGRITASDGIIPRQSGIFPVCYHSFPHVRIYPNGPMLLVLDSWIVGDHLFKLLRLRVLGAHFLMLYVSLGQVHLQVIRQLVARPWVSKEREKLWYLYGIFFSIIESLVGIISLMYPFTLPLY